MRNSTFKTLIGGASILAIFGLGGCATHDYVDKQVAGVQSQITTTQAEVSSLRTQVASNSSQLADHNARIAKIDADAQAALAKADQSPSFNTTQLASETVYFKTGSAKLSPEDEQKLADLANRLKVANNDVRLEIHGYTDNTGSPSRNEKLGSARADNVFAYLGKQGLPLNRMEMMSHGEESPVAPNDNKDGRQQNRRVVVSVVGRG